MGRRGMMVVAVLAAVAAGAGAWAQGSANGDYWDQAGTLNLRNGTSAPSARRSHVAVWAGTRLIIWGGSSGGPLLNTGGVYTCSTDTWEAKPNLNAGVGAPTGRYSASGVWTGSRLLVFGGVSNNNAPTLNTGGVYNPDTDSWETGRPNLLSGTGAPGGRYDAFVAWQDGKLYVWGGTEWTNGGSGSFWLPRGVFTGGVYNYVTDTWESVPGFNAPVLEPQFNKGGTWTGDAIVARGGAGGNFNAVPSSNGELSAGGVFRLDSMAWASTPTIHTSNLALRREYHTAVWTGEAYLDFGGFYFDPQIPGDIYFKTGLCYDPGTDTFLTRASLNQGLGAPSARTGHAAAWTGAHMFIWGGFNERPPSGGDSPPAVDGGLYDPATDTWVQSPTMLNSTGAPQAIKSATMVFNGDRAFVWGGFTGGGASTVYLNVGGVYVPPRVAPTIRSQPLGNVAQPAVLPLGQFWRYRITVYGCPRSTLNVTGLVPWMTLKMLDTGAFIEGTPPASDNGVGYNISITASNGIGTAATQAFTVWAGYYNPPPVAFTSAPPGNAAAGEPFSYTAAAGGGASTPVISVVSGIAWLTLAPGPGGTAVLSGTPPMAASGTVATVVLKAESGISAPAYQSVVLNVGFSPKDVNRDAAITVGDVQLCVNIIVRVVQPAWQGQGDVDGDSKVNVIDLQKIVNKLLSP